MPSISVLRKSAKKQDELMHATAPEPIRGTNPYKKCYCAHEQRLRLQASPDCIPSSLTIAVCTAWVNEYERFLKGASAHERPLWCQKLGTMTVGRRVFFMLRSVADDKLVFATLHAAAAVEPFHPSFAMTDRPFASSLPIPSARKCEKVVQDRGQWYLD